MNMFMSDYGNVLLLEINGKHSPANLQNQPPVGNLENKNKFNTKLPLYNCVHVRGR